MNSMVIDTEPLSEWVYKCAKCQHSYKRKCDDETVYCRKRNGKCEFKEYKAKRGKKHD